MIKTFALYCKELPDREKALREHLRDRGVAATFFRGVHGRTWGLRTSLEYDPGKHLPPGHVGLNLGSWFLHQHMWLSSDGLPGDTPFVVLEDDALLPPGYPGHLEDVLAELKKDAPDWDLAFLGLAEREPHVWHKVTERIGGPDSRLCRLNDPFGTHAYLVRRRALPILLDHMTVAERNLDQQLWARVLKPGLLKWAAVLPSLVRQRTFDHDATGKPEWEGSCVHPDDDSPEAPRSVPASLDPDRSHVDRVTGGDAYGPPIEKPTPEVIAATTLLTDPYPCIFRGEVLSDNGRSSSGRTVPLYQCARLNVACHTKAGEYRERAGAAARECKTCDLRLQMAPDSPRPRLPIPTGHFNPSIALWEGRLILATRDSWGHSRVALWELKNALPDWSGEWDARPIGSYASPHPQAPRLEDPRLFVAPHPDTGRPALHAMFNLPDGYPPSLVQVGFVRFARDLGGIEHTEVFPSPHGNRYEKNWVPFRRDADDELYWVYATKPRHVVLGRASYETPNDLPWTGGFVRGGAAPARVEPGDFDHPHKRGVYYHFFHGCLKRLQGSVYTAGCAVFDGAPPFQVMRQTPVPILWPDLPAPHEDVTKRYVLWPGGAVYHAGAWHLALGIDDTYSRVVRLPVATVEAALSDRPDPREAQSLRGTRMANNVPGD